MIPRIVHIEAACDLARRYGATVEVDRKFGRAAAHPMLRVVFNGASELITVSLTSPHALYPVLGDMKRALRKLGALKANGPGERRRRKRKQRDRVAPTLYRREPTPVRRTFRNQLRDWQFHNSERVA